MPGALATAYVQILPSFEGITARLREGFSGTDAIGREAGVQLGTGVAGGVAGAAARVRASLDESVAGAGAVGVEAGAKLAEGLGAGGVEGSAKVRAGIEEAAAAAGLVGEEMGAKLAAGIGTGGVEGASKARAALEETAAAGGAVGEEIGAKLSSGIGTGGAEGSAKARTALEEVGAAGKLAGEEAGSGLAELGSRIGELAKTFVEFLAIEKVVEFAKASVEAGEEVERTSSLIEAQLHATGDASHISAEAIQELTTTISDSAGKSRNEILLSEQALLRFSNVANQPGKGNDIFTRASKDAADLAAVMHTSVPAAAALLGKALNNPTVGLTRLTRAGVTFTAQQTAQIKSLTNSGHLLEAQGIILGHFESQFGGAAAASATPLDRLKASVSNLESSLGQALLPILDAGITKLADFATTASDAAQGGLSKISAAFDALQNHSDIDLAKVLGVGVGSPVISGLDTLRDLVHSTVTDIEADFHALVPGVESASRGFAELGIEVGGAALAGVDALAKALHPLAEALSATLGFLGAHASVFAGPAAEALALAVAIKGVTLALAGIKAARAFGTAIAGGLAAARQSMASLTYSTSRVSAGLGKVGSAALSTAGLGAVGLAAAGAGIAIDLLVKHYEQGKAQVQAFTQSIIADNDTIGAQTKVAAAQAIQSSGAADAASKLGISYNLVAAAATGSASAQAQLSAILGPLISGSNEAAGANGEYGVSVASVAGKQAAAAANAEKLRGAIASITKQLGTGKAAADVTAKLYKAMGLNADGSAKSVGDLGSEVGKTGGAAGGAAPKVATLSAAQERLNTDTAAYNTALAGIAGRISAILGNFQNLGAAEDQLASDTLALGASVKQNGKDFASGTAKALANRAALRQVGSDYASFATQVSLSHKPLKEQQSLLNGRRDDILSYARSLGLSGPQLATFTKELGALDVNAQQPAIKKARVDLDKAGLDKSTGAVNAFTQKTLANVPAVTKTAITTTGIPPSTGAVNAFVQKTLGSIPGSKSTAISETGAEAAAAAVRQLHENEDALYDKTITITTDYIAHNQNAKNQHDPGADVAAPGGQFRLSPAATTTFAAGAQAAQAALTKLLSSYAKFTAYTHSAGLLASLEGDASGITAALADGFADIQQVLVDAAHKRGDLTKTISADSADQAKANKYIRDNTKNYVAATHDLVKARAELAKAPTGSKAAAKATAEIKHDESVINSYTAAQKSAKKAADELAQAQKQLALLSKLPATASTVVAQLQAQNSQLHHLASDRDAAASTLAADKQKLQDAINVKASDVASFSSQLTGDAAGVFGQAASGEKAPTARSLQIALGGELTKIRKFGKDLADLQKRGLSKDILRDLASQGADAGLAQADALDAATAAQLSKLNSTQSQIDSAAAGVASSAGTYLDQSSITSLTGTVAQDGAALKTAQAKMDTLAKTMQQELEKALALGKGTRQHAGANFVNDLSTGIASKTPALLKQISGLQRQVAGTGNAGAVKAPAGHAVAAKPTVNNHYTLAGPTATDLMRAIRKDNSQQAVLTRIRVA